MEAIIVKVVALWAVGVIGGAAEWCNHKIVAATCMLLVMCGFTMVALNRNESELHRSNGYVGARVGSREYHLGECADARNIGDPLWYETEIEWWRKGYSAHTCVTRTRLAGKD